MDSNKNENLSNVELAEAIFPPNSKLDRHCLSLSTRSLKLDFHSFKFRNINSLVVDGVSDAKTTPGVLSPVTDETVVAIVPNESH